MLRQQNDLGEKIRNMKLIAPLSSLLLFSSPLLAAEPENLIDNPGFESGGVAWKLEKGRAEIVKGDALTGDHFVQMTDQSERALSFTWISPIALIVGITVGCFVSKMTSEKKSGT